MRHAPRADFPRKPETPRPRLRPGFLRPAFWFGQPLQRVAVADAAALARLAAAPGGLRRIALPADAAAKAEFLKRWAARTAAGLAGAVLVLPLAALAQGANFVAAAEVAGVEEVTLLPDGSARLDLANGRSVTVPAAEVQLAASGEVMISAAVAESVAAAASATALAGGGAAALGGLAALGAAGGGGGGESDDPTPVAPSEPEPPTEPTPLFLKVSDGYIADALVFRDSDGDGAHDVGIEASTRTDADGDFDVTLLPGSGRLVAVGGIDITTGAAFRGVMTAPEGALVITPLTTLVQAFVESEAAAGRSVSAESAATTLAGKLGLSANLLTVDPVEAADDAADASGTAALAAAAQIANTLIVAAAAGADSEAVARALAQSIAGADEGGTPLEDAATIQTALQAGLAAGTDASQIAGLVAAANTQVATAAAQGSAADATAVIEDAQTVVSTVLAEKVEGREDLTEIDYDELEEVAPAPLTPAGLEYDPVINAADAAGDGFIVSGTGRVGSSVTVTFGDRSETVTVDEDGAWSADFTGDRPADGAAVELKVQGRSEDGSIASRVLTRTVTIDTAAPEAPAITAIAGDGTVNIAENGGQVTISGTGEVGAVVAVSLGETALGDDTVDGEGRWEITVDGATLTADGAGTTITATATDAADNTGVAGTATFEVDLVAPGAPQITQIATDDTVNAAEATAGVAVTGIAEAGAAVAVTIGSVTRTGQADGEGNWTVTFEAGTLGDGVDQTASAVATDVAGNAGTAGTRTVTVDTAPPAVAITDPIADDDRINAAEAGTGLTVTGTAEAGATVSVTLGSTTKAATLTGTDWTVDFASNELPADGTHAITASATDAAGNAAVTSQDVTLDRAAPSAPTIATIAGDATTGTAYVNAAEAGAGFTVTGTAPGEAGATVTVAIGTGETPVTATGIVDESGNWTVTFASSDTAGLADAEGVAVTAHVTDLAGNEGAETEGYSVIIDTVAPAEPVLDTVSGDDTISSGELGTDLTLGGNAEANSAIAVTFGTATASTTADSSGAWTATIPVANLPPGPSATLTVTATDAAGNVSAATSRAITVESPPPVATVTVNGFADLDVFVAATILGTGQPGTPGGTGITIPSQDGTLAADLIGTGLVWNENTDPTHGTFTGLDFRDLSDGGNVTVLSIRGLDIPATVFAAAVNGETPAASLDALLSAYAVDLTGSGGIDDFGGSDHADTLRGGAGEDYIYASLGSDTIDGGADFDQVTYEEIEGTGIVATAGATAGDWTVTAAGEDGFTDRLIGIEALRGTLQADTLTGGSGNDVFRPLGGSDRVDGGDGFDQARYDRDDRFDGGTGAITADFTTGGVVDGFTYDGTVTDGFGHTDYLVNIEQVRGGAGNDTMRAGATGLHFRGEAGDDSLVGGAGADTLDGGAGDDRLYGGDGNDTLLGGDGERDRLYGGAGDDLIDGGAGTRDRAYFTGATQGVSANLSTGVATGEGNDTLVGIERLTGSAYDDTLVGTDQNNGFQGGAGADSIVGGGGWDFASYNDATGAVQINLATGIVSGGAGDDTLSGIEEIEGSNYGDSITGDGNDNWFVLDTHYEGDPNAGTNNGENGGADTVDGGGGWDTVDYAVEGETATQGIVADLQAGTVIDTRGNTDSLSNIEEVIGTGHADAMTAGEAAMMFAGQGGDDTLTGGAGADTLIGGAGNDSLTGGDGADVFDVTGGGADVIADFDAAQGDVLAGVSAEALATALLGAETVEGGAVLSFGEDSVTFLDHSVESLQQALGNDPLLAAVNAAANVTAMSTALAALDAEGFGSLGSDRQLAVAADLLANRPGTVTIGFNAQVGAVTQMPPQLVNGTGVALNDTVTGSVTLPLPINLFGTDELTEAGNPAYLLRRNDPEHATTFQIGTGSYMSDGTNVAFSIEHLTDAILQEELGTALYEAATGEGGVFADFTEGDHAILELIAFQSTGDVDPETGETISTDGTEVVVTLVSRTADAIADFLAGMPADVAVLIKGGTLASDEWTNHFVAVTGTASLAYGGPGYASQQAVRDAVDAYDDAHMALAAVLAGGATGAEVGMLFAAVAALPEGASFGGATLPPAYLTALTNAGASPGSAAAAAAAINARAPDSAAELFPLLTVTVADFEGRVQLSGWIEKLAADGTTAQFADGSVTYTLSGGGTVTLTVPGLTAGATALDGTVTGAAFAVEQGTSAELLNLSINGATLAGAIEQGQSNPSALVDLFLAKRFDAVGTTGADSFGGTPGDDILRGLAGNDTILGSLGNDTIHGNTDGAGEAGDSVSYAGLSGHRLRVQLDDGTVDIVTGAAAPEDEDLSFAEAAYTDELFGIGAVTGSPGDDLFIGGDGNDTFTGGGGRDTFILSGGQDVITDFSFALDDLDAGGFTLNPAGRVDATVGGIPATRLAYGEGGVHSITLIGYSLAEFDAQLAFWTDERDPPHDVIADLDGIDVSLAYLGHRAFGIPDDAEYFLGGWIGDEDAVPVGNGYLLRSEVTGTGEGGVGFDYEAWFLLDSFGQFVAGVRGANLTMEGPLTVSVPMIANDAVYVQHVTLTPEGETASTTEVYRLMLTELEAVITTEYNAQNKTGDLSDLLTESRRIATFTPQDGADVMIVEGGAKLSTGGFTDDFAYPGDQYYGFVLSNADLVEGTGNEAIDDTILRSYLGVQQTDGSYALYDLGGVLEPEAEQGENPDDLDIIDAVAPRVDETGLNIGFEMRVDTGESNIVHRYFAFANPAEAPVLYTPEGQIM